jgi:hypothetical protein
MNSFSDDAFFFGGIAARTFAVIKMRVLLAVIICDACVAANGNANPSNPEKDTSGEQWMRFHLGGEHTSDGLHLVSILPTSNSSYPVKDVRDGYIRDLHRDGVAYGHSPELVATEKEFEAAGWDFRPIFDRLIEEGATVLSKLHSGCESVTPVLSGSPLSKYVYRGLYSNVFLQKSNKLREVPEKQRLAPWVSAVFWKAEDDADIVPGAPHRDRPTDFHTDGGSREVITLWLPIIAEPVVQWPIVWIDPVTLQGCGYPPPNHTSCRPGHSADYIRAQDEGTAGAVKPQLMHWSSMVLGDWVAWDGARLFHASGEITANRGKYLPRVALSMQYKCQPLLKPKAPRSTVVETPPPESAEESAEAPADRAEL